MLSATDRYARFALHSVLRLTAMVIVRLNDQIVEVLHDIFELRFYCR